MSVVLMRRHSACTDALRVITVLVSVRFDNVVIQGWACDGSPYRFCLSLYTSHSIKNKDSAVQNGHTPIDFN
jgi:hypothetical protein